MPSAEFLDKHRASPPVSTSGRIQALEFDTNKLNSQDWLDPINMSALQRAVQKRAKSVVLNGNEFTVTYGHYIVPDEESVFLKRKDGSFAPCGYVRISKILRFKFEDKG